MDRFKDKIIRFPIDLTIYPVYSNETSELA